MEGDDQIVGGLGLATYAIPAFTVNQLGSGLWGLEIAGSAHDWATALAKVQTPGCAFRCLPCCSRESGPQRLVACHLVQH